MIKEMKLYTKSDRTSCHRWEANQFRLFLHSGAFWLLHRLRQAAPRKSLWRKATFETIRRAFLKIAVRIEELGSRIKIALPSAYPYQPALVSMARLYRRPRPLSQAASAARRAPNVNPQPLPKTRLEKPPSTRPLPRAPRSNPPALMNNCG